MKSYSTRDKRAKDVKRGFQIVWASLASHLDYTYLKSSEGKLFHKRTTQEYAELMAILSRLY